MNDEVLRNITLAVAGMSATMAGLSAVFLVFAFGRIKEILVDVDMSSEKSQAAYAELTMIEYAGASSLSVLALNAALTVAAVYSEIVCMNILTGLSLFVFFLGVVLMVLPLLVLVSLDMIVSGPLLQLASRAGKREEGS